MKIYGLFKIINNNNNISNFELYNKLHPNNILNNLPDQEPFTFFDFFYEGIDAMLDADIDIQYFEYYKFKNELDSLSKREILSMYDYDRLTEMLSRLIVAENKFIKYKNDTSIIDKIERQNITILENIIANKSKYAKDINKYFELYNNYYELEIEVPNELKILFDMKNISPNNYLNTIMFPDSIISFYRTNIEIQNGIIQNELNIFEYVVFELENINETVNLKYDQERVNKLIEIKKLCEECNIEIPDKVLSELSETDVRINYQYNGKNLIIVNKENIEKIDLLNL